MSTSIHSPQSSISFLFFLFLFLILLLLFLILLLLSFSVHSSLILLLPNTFPFLPFWAVSLLLDLGQRVSFSLSLSLLFHFLYFFCFFVFLLSASPSCFVPSGNFNLFSYWLHPKRRCYPLPLSLFIFSLSLSLFIFSLSPSSFSLSVHFHSHVMKCIPLVDRRLIILSFDFLSVIESEGMEGSHRMTTRKKTSQRILSSLSFSLLPLNQSESQFSFKESLSYFFFFSLEWETERKRERERERRIWSWCNHRILEFMKLSSSEFILISFIFDTLT